MKRYYPIILFNIIEICCLVKSQQRSECDCTILCINDWIPVCIITICVFYFFFFFPILFLEQFIEYDENNSGDIGKLRPVTTLHTPSRWIVPRILTNFPRCHKLIPSCDNYFETSLTSYLVLDIMELKRMMEKLGQAKTHLELKKMIAEVDTTNSGTISYPEFLQMMLGKKNSVLKM